MSGVRPAGVILAWKLRSQAPEEVTLGSRTVLRYGRDDDAGFAGVQNKLVLDNIPHDPDEERIDVFSLPVTAGGIHPTPRLTGIGEKAVLASGIDASETSISVSSIPNSSDWGSGPDFSVRIGDEILEMTSRSGVDLTVVRGVHGTTAASHSTSAPVYPQTFRGGSGVDHMSLLLTGNASALDPPTIAVASKLNGHILTLTPPTDTRGVLGSYLLYRATSSPAEALLRTDPAAIGETQVVSIDLSDADSTSATYFFKAKSKTLAGVVSTSFSNEVSSGVSVITDWTDFDTESALILDAGTSGATAAHWIEISLGSSSPGFIRVHSTK